MPLLLSPKLQLIVAIVLQEIASNTPGKCLPPLKVQLVEVTVMKIVMVPKIVIVPNVGGAKQANGVQVAQLFAQQRLEYGLSNRGRRDT